MIYCITLFWASTDCVSKMTTFTAQQQDPKTNKGTYICVTPKVGNENNGNSVGIVEYRVHNCLTGMRVIKHIMGEPSRLRHKVNRHVLPGSRRIISTAEPVFIVLLRRHGPVRRHRQDDMLDGQLVHHAHGADASRHLAKQILARLGDALPRQLPLRLALAVNDGKDLHHGAVPKLVVVAAATDDPVDGALDGGGVGPVLLRFAGAGHVLEAVDNVDARGKILCAAGLGRDGHVVPLDLPGAVGEGGLRAVGDGGSRGAAPHVYGQFTGRVTKDECQRIIERFWFASMQQG